MSTFLDCYSDPTLVSKFAVKSVRVWRKFVVKNVVWMRKFIAFFAIRWYTIFAVWDRGCEYVPNRDGKVIEMERKQTAEAIDY